MADKSFEELPLRTTWVALGHRVAAGVGAFTALASLFRHVSLTAACERGALAWFALIVLTRIVRWLVERTVAEAPGTDPAR